MTSHISRIEIDIDWFAGLRDRIRRLPIDTFKSWLTPVLAAIAVGLLVLIYMGGPKPAPSPRPPAPDPGPPAPGKVEPKPKPKVDPAPDVEPGEPGLPAARAPETPLSKALRDYHRRFPAVVPKTLWELADKLDSGELTDKDASIKFYKRDAVPLSQALDGIFTPGIDASTKEGKVTRPAAISGPLRQTARALCYKPPASADPGSQSFAPESP